MNPDVKLIDETEKGEPVPYSPTLTAVQKWLWRCHQEDVASVKKLAGKDSIILLHLGDIGHGDKYASQLVSHRKADQVLITVSNFEPWFKLPNLKAVRIAHGTAAHNFGAATLEIVVAEQLKALHRKDVRTMRHGLLTVDDVSIDWAHHGPYTGSRNWLKGNVARLYLISLMKDEFKHGNKPPRVVLRGHYHEPVRETKHETDRGVDYTADIFVIPAYCGLTEYSQKVTRSNPFIGCGVVALELLNGELFRVHKFYRSEDLRTREKL